MKPTLIAPGNKRLKLEYDELLSVFAFNFNLRPYNLDGSREAVMKILYPHGVDPPAGVYTRPLFSSI
jgi:hypothetical protein